MSTKNINPKHPEWEGATPVQMGSKTKNFILTAILIGAVLAVIYFNYEGENVDNSTNLDKSATNIGLNEGR